MTSTTGNNCTNGTCPNYTTMPHDFGTFERNYNTSEYNTSNTTTSPSTTSTTTTSTTSCQCYFTNVVPLCSNDTNISDACRFTADGTEFNISNITYDWNFSNETVVCSCSTITIDPNSTTTSTSSTTYTTTNTSTTSTTSTSTSTST